MNTTILGKHPATPRQALLVCSGLLAITLGSHWARAVGQDQPATPRDSSEPRFLAPPVPSARVAQPGTVEPAPVEATPAATTPAKPSTGPTDGPPDSGKTLYDFKADQLDVRAALAQFARANNLNIVPDNDVVGTVTVDLHNLPLEQVMRALLEAADCTWHEEGGLIRVRNTETRTFTVDYLRLRRNGIGQSSAMLASGTGGAGGGAGGGMGGGMGGGAAGGAGGSTGGNVSSWGGSSVNLTAYNPIDFWAELREELGFVLTDAGKRSMSINMTAGILQVTDRPSALKRVESYLKGVGRNIHRQVDLETKIYSVALNDQFQFGIDWVHVASAYGGLLGFGGSTLPVANGGAQLQNSAIGGLNRPIGSTTPGDTLASLVFSNFNTAVAVNALSQQGKVEVISKPRIRTLNNQTALMKVGEDVPFFNTSTLVQQNAAAAPITQQNTVVSTVTIGTILSITPQISEDEWISLDISPVLTSLKQVVSFGNAAGNSSSSGNGNTSGATAPDLDTKQASTLVRVRDANTVVLGGLIQDQTAENHTKVPLLGDIPLLGKLFTGTFRLKQKTELVIFVTPRIVRESEQSVDSNIEAKYAEPKKKM